MRGEFHGLQKKILDENPCAFYRLRSWLWWLSVHCVVHGVVAITICLLHTMVVHRGTAGQGRLVPPLLDHRLRRLCSPCSAATQVPPQAPLHSGNFSSFCMSIDHSSIRCCILVWNFNWRLEITFPSEVDFFQKLLSQVTGQRLIFIVTWFVTNMAKEIVHRSITQLSCLHGNLQLLSD
jgi:hypothetical protein